MQEIFQSIFPEFPFSDTQLFHPLKNHLSHQTIKKSDSTLNLKKYLKTFFQEKQRNVFKERFQKLVKC